MDNPPEPVNNLEQKPYKVSFRRKIFRWMIMITLIYCSVGIALFYLQDKLLFHPDELAPDYQFQFDVPFKEVNIPMKENVSLNMVQFLPKDSIAKGVIIYFHGNRGNISKHANNAVYFTKMGYQVWMPDYPGYGKSTGERTETLMNNEAREVYKLAHSQFGSDSIIVYGRSLGSGVAAYIASNQSIKMLILESPYYSIPSLFSTYAFMYPTNRMAHYKFPVGEYLKETKAPVYIFHGTSDGTIPYRQAAELKKVLKPADQFITIEDGGHNNLRSFPLFREKLDSLLSK